MRTPAILALVLAATPALGDGVYKDRERLVERTIVAKPICPAARLVRLTDRSPDYAGSALGLAKPSYYGERRPDDGLSLPRW